MENNNLNELNTILFDTLRGVKDGSIDDKKAQTVTNVANSIINNAKMQLSAFKLTKGQAYRDAFGLPESSAGAIESDNKYDQMHEFALEKGYNNVSEAINKMSKQEFMKAFYKWIKQ